MAKKNKPANSSASYGKCFAGIHTNCGGEVTYSFTPSRGYNYCNKCGQSSLKGDPIIMEKKEVTI